MKSYISGHLQNLIDEFRRYFPDVVNEGTLFIRNPFRCEVKDVQLGMYIGKIFELTNSSSDKDIHETQDLVTFWLACATIILNWYIMLCKYLCHSPQRIYVNQPSLHLSASNRKIETNSLMLKLIYDAQIRSSPE